VIEKKNDEIFNITRNKDIEIEDAKKGLEIIIEEVKNQSRKDTEKLTTQVERL
jgi:hypothetical protein